jgi:hypothetical protein
MKDSRLPNFYIQRNLLQTENMEEQVTKWKLNWKQHVTEKQDSRQY